MRWTLLFGLALVLGGCKGGSVGVKDGGDADADTDADNDAPEVEAGWVAM